MAWPKGLSRKDFFAAREREKALKEVMPDTSPAEQHNEQPVSRPRPKLAEVRAEKPKAAKKTWQMKAGNNWETAVETDGDNVNRLEVPADMIPEGMSFEFKTRSIFGQEMKQRLNAAYRAGWTPVHADDFDGRFAQMWSQDDSGYIVYEACILCTRPIEMTEAARKREKKRAQEQIAMKEQAFKGGEMNATGANHPSATSTNRITRTMERIEIPKD